MLDGLLRRYSQLTGCDVVVVSRTIQLIVVGWSFFGHVELSAG
ncbi:MAG: hypothetical protein ACPG7F_03530 [Aggregatilineales bacterium]